MSEQELENESSADLLEYIRWKDDPECLELAKTAFRVFTFRYQLDLQKKLIPICRGWGYDKQVAAEIAYRTFERVWKYPKFDLAKANQQDPHTAITFYLYGIAQRQLANYKKVENGEANPFNGDEEIIREFPDVTNLGIGKERKAILMARQEHIIKLLDRLSPKHRIIYLTYKYYEDITKEGHKLPRHLLENLRNELNLTQNSIRVYKMEAFNAVDTYLNTYGSK